MISVKARAAAAHPPPSAAVVESPPYSGAAQLTTSPRQSPVSWLRLSMNSLKPSRSARTLRFAKQGLADSSDPIVGIIEHRQGHARYRWSAHRVQRLKPYFAVVWRAVEAAPGDPLVRDLFDDLGIPLAQSSSDLGHPVHVAFVKLSDTLEAVGTPTSTSTDASISAMGHHLVRDCAPDLPHRRLEITRSAAASGGEQKPQLIFALRRMAHLMRLGHPDSRDSRVCTSSTIIYALVDIGNTAAGLHRAGSAIEHGLAN